jgi:hypothetical protein
LHFALPAGLPRPEAAIGWRKAVLAALLSLISGR